MRDVNKVLHPGYGGVNDVKLSLQDYYESINAFRQDDLSANGLLRFKNLAMCNNFAGYAMLIQGAIPAYLLTRFLTGPVYRAHADYKIAFPIMVTIMGMWAVRNSYKPIPRRIYTEIFTDESTDGTYVRQALRDHKPNIWNKVSPQLYSLGYRFEELNEVSTKEFPTALLK